MSAIKVVDFKQTQANSVSSVMEKERRIHGAPEQSVQNIYSAESDQLLSGTWSSEVGKWKIDYSNRHEFCYLLAGHMVLTDEEGVESTFVAGDAFMVPKGFKGAWEVIEPVTKYYVIYKDKD